MTTHIRKAIVKDGPQIAPLIYEAIGEIANRLTGESEVSRILQQLQVLFARTDNRHSYLNTYVAENEETKKILGILVLYSGEDGPILDASLQHWLQTKNAPITAIDVEAHPDELYIDTICVHKDVRGLGIGTELLLYAEQVALSQGFTKLSLNVEIQKENARKLYERLGYSISEPWTIISQPFYHMVKKINKEKQV